MENHKECVKYWNFQFSTISYAIYGYSLVVTYLLKDTLLNYMCLN